MNEGCFEAVSMLLSQLDGLAAAGNQKALAFLTKPMRGQRQTLISRFMQSYGAPTPVSFDPFDDQVLRHANSRSFGHEQLPTLDIAHSHYVISSRNLECRGSPKRRLRRNAAGETGPAREIGAGRSANVADRSKCR